MEKRKWIWLIAILGAVAASLYYRLMVNYRLEQTSALFIGIPALIAAICVLTPSPHSATGTAVKSVTLFLCIAGIFLGEGFICILMASPLFFIGAIANGMARDRARKKGPMLPCLVLILFMGMSMEGVNRSLSLGREETISVEKVVAASQDQVEGALSAVPRLPGKLPMYLRMGFPRPVAVTGYGTVPGMKYTVHFAGGEGKPGDLVLEVTQHEQGKLSLRALSDNSHISHWIKWETSMVEWNASGQGRTSVRWTLRYRRLLDPAWYFRPWERYAVALTASQLIEDVATPRRVP
jgi:hypothetical protein